MRISDWSSDVCSSDLGVTIGSIHRTQFFSFTPTIEIRDVRIPQPAWAGSGAFAQVRVARVRFNAFGALTGRVSPSAIEIDGLRLALVRDKDRKSTRLNSSH